MYFNEYQKLAYKTANKNSEAARQRIGELPIVLVYSVLETIRRCGAKAGSLKGHLFYGREIRSSGLVQPQIERDKMLERMQNVPTDLIHSILGMADELAEITEVVSEYIYNGKRIDWDNLTEEYGDMLWFFSLGNTARGVKNEDVAELNIEKLKERFGDEFSEEKANNRDLDSEREVFSK